MCGWRDGYDKLKELNGESQVVPGASFRFPVSGFRNPFIFPGAAQRFH